MVVLENTACYHGSKIFRPERTQGGEALVGVEERLSVVDHQES